MSADRQYDEMKKHTDAAAMLFGGYLRDYMDRAVAAGTEPDLADAIETYVPMVILEFIWDTPPPVIAYIKRIKARVDAVAKGMQTNPEVRKIVEEATEGNLLAPTGKPQEPKQ